MDKTVFNDLPTIVCANHRRIYCYTLFSLYRWRYCEHDDRQQQPWFIPEPFRCANWSGTCRRVRLLQFAELPVGEKVTARRSGRQGDTVTDWKNCYTPSAAIVMRSRLYLLPEVATVATTFIRERTERHLPVQSSV
ncbi:hypothetical protein M513_04657 [Trichuris suis]|uniref:Uncharacterized protein n=1 Tax=Trichuris suis TaxID=68888 RepID=A0A085MBB4_9BILA|nr:hypothetical protein M513_04657 [Trichuris suis]